MSFINTDIEISSQNLQREKTPYKQENNIDFSSPKNNAEVLFVPLRSWNVCHWVLLFKRRFNAWLQEKLVLILKSGLKM